MTKKELIEALKDFDDDDIVICMDFQGAWDNIEKVKKWNYDICIVFGGGSPFSDE